uniref:RNA-directed DNA polymerase, eukaryota n=1 Tax=Tanacetum cinerariifolium TaxID=118510 RepID=A0A6L2MPL6_TANCI|nr:RNA-directed DNA polymerase, eukaryota [Tanacetum cinerariifolium]
MEALLHVLAERYMNVPSTRDGSDGVINRRTEVVSLIQQIEKAETLEVAQKAKIKWAIKGDENSKYYHGILNKKIGRLTIRGVLAEGKWLESPYDVKNELYVHFKNRFEKYKQEGIRLNIEFLNRISVDQNEFLEGEVSNEEVKKAVWDCGVDKAPGPDGFTFGFYQKNWNLIESDVVKAVQWPISLIGSMYKIVAKILANRLVTVLGDLVNEIQYTFVADRQILDGPFVLNEVVQWCKNRKKQTMVFKVDFEKAYDSVRWEFVDDVLKKFGFGEKWCLWIRSCLQSLRGLVLVNGSPTQEFQFFKGLKQGDPLSPFLFILVMESLHISFQRVVDAGLFRGIKVGSASGLHINMNKSKTLGISVDNNLVEQAVAKIGCMVLKTPFKYIGSKVGVTMSRIQSWSDVIEGMEGRLSRWKLKTLSIGGRFTLLKSVLDAIHIYHMSMFKVPMQVLQKLESIRARFFNGAEVNSRKPSWVRWKNVLASKNIGGLGVSSLYALNRALMFKWVWRFLSQKTSLWARVITALHGERGKIGKVIKSSYPSIWLNIVQEVEVLKRHGIDLMSFITPTLGNGLDTAFWDVPWRGDLSFKELAPRVYALEHMKGISVAAKLTKDRWTWNLDGACEFSVASVMRTIDDYFYTLDNTKTRWVKEVPIKINIRAWKVKNDCFPTKFNMSRRGIELESILCPLCNSSAEASRHLFFSCQFVRDIMKKITRWWELKYRDFDSYKGWLVWMTSIRLPTKAKKVFEGICYIVWCHTWNWRNMTIFGQESTSKANIFDEIVTRSFWWIKSRCKARFSYNEWLKNPSFI